MQLQRTIVTAALLVAITGSVSYACRKAPPTEPKLTPDQIAVHKVINSHVEAIRKADRDALAKLWIVDHAHQKFLETDSAGEATVKVNTISDAFKYWTKTPTPKTAGKVKSLHIVNDKMAFVELTLKWNGSTYNDYLTLFKVGEDWKLVNKTYVAEHPPKKPAFRYGG